MAIGISADLLNICSWVILSITNKMQRYTIFFITVNALHVSGGYSTHHQELKNCTQSIWYMSSLLAATASGSSKQACSLYLKELFPKVDKANSPAPLRVSC